MRLLTLTLLLTLFPASLIAEPNSSSQIQEFFHTCRTETDLPFVKSPSLSGFYYVGKRNNQYVVKVDIQLRYPAYFSADEFSAAMHTFEAVKHWIIGFYRQYGLQLDVDFEHAPYDPRSSNPHPAPQEQRFVIYVRRNTGSHMKALYWGVNSDWSIQEQAIVIAHEFSHLLHLKDEYQTAMGAASLEEAASFEDDSLMKNVDHPQPRLYVRHIRQILSPLCEPAKTLMAQESSVISLPQD